MIKCKVINCDNDSDHGVMFGDLCAPCFEIIKYSRGRNSQAYRNKLLSTRLQLQLDIIKKELINADRS